MDYNDNTEGIDVITNQTLNGGPVVIGTRDVITANDVINNRPIAFNSTRNMDQFYNCDNNTANFVPQNLAKDTAVKGQESSTKNSSKNKTTWQELSPKKERKSLLSGESSGSGSSSTASSPTKSWKSSEKGTNQNQMLTWRDVSPTKSDRGIVSSSSDSQYSPKREPGRLSSSSDSQYSPRRDPAKLSSSSDSQYSPRRDTSRLSSSSSDSHYSPKRRPCRGQKAHMRSPEHTCSRHRTGAINHNETYKVHESPEHGHDCFSPPSPSRGFPAVGAMDDGASNDYFYDEDFTVQFDTNLRESSPGLNCTCVDPNLMIGFPHIVTGSYLSFGGEAKGTHILDQNSTELFCPDESELSYSRNSAMDVSTSEREMMCSSDMLDFSDNPLFSPSPTGDLHGTGENVMTDSLDKMAVKCQFPVLGLTPEQYQGQNTMDMSSSRTSSENNFCLNCCPRKDEYHLSFVGSQGSKGSGSDLDNSLTSVESGQGRCSQQQGSICSTDGEECSDSFHFCYSANGPHGNHGKGKGLLGSRGQKFHALGGIQETSMEHSASSEDSINLSTKPTVTSKQDLKLLSTSGTLPRCGATKGCQVTSPKKKFQGMIPGQLPSRSTLPLNGRQRSKKVTSWRQVKSLRRLGKLDNVLDPSRSNSMPDLCVHQAWQSLSSQDIHRLAESFHSKRHSAYLLDLYQRVKDQSNPVSPETMANIEQILFQHPIGTPHHHHSDHTQQTHHNNNCSDLGRDDSYSDHTLTNSHAQFMSTGVTATTHSSPSPHGQPHPLQYSTRKRILDWLEKEKFEATNKSKGSQTEVTKCTKETVVSPTTITLWSGTKNFSSQFPPSMKDCAIQTTVTEDVKVKKPSMHDSSQQTMPISDKHAVLSMLPESFNELDEIWPKFDSPDGKKLKAFMPRSKSADSPRKTSSLAVGVCEKNMFYSHKSLPDLSFLSAAVFATDSEISLFDPLPMNLPLPVFSESEKYAKTQEYIRNKAAYHSHYARQEPHSGASYKRSRSAPPRNPINANLSRNCTESGSSSSGFSTSSTSSGIDPGYSEPRSFTNGSPSNDIERLLFYPPHVEISSSSKSPCNVCKSVDCTDMGQISTGPPPQLLTNQLSDQIGANKTIVKPTAEKPGDKKNPQVY